MTVPTVVGITRELTRWSMATPAPAGDPGHLVPEDVWAAIVAGAQARSDQLVVLAASHPDRLTLPDRTIAARSHGGLMAGGPRLGVVHSAETPLAAGYAYSIAANWFATLATTSATVMIDPIETVRLLPDNVISYAVGPRANGFTVNVEQAGRASLSLAQWTTAAGLAQMRRVAQYLVECRDRWGIPLRWATDAQIRAAAAGGTPQGWCEHADIARVLGGTTHSDPRPNYPRGQLMALAVQLGTPTQEDDDLTEAERKMLQEVHAQLCGPNMHRFQETGPAGEPQLTGATNSKGQPAEATRFADAMDAYTMAKQVARVESKLDQLLGRLK